MKRILAGTAVALVLLTGAVLAIPVRIEARDYGQSGQAFPVIEPDLLATIATRLKRAEASGELARTNEMFARRAEAKVRRPPSVSGISPATQTRAWDFDPTVQVEHDIRDQKGNLIAAAGQRINPLDFVPIRQALVFVDGDDAEQMAWAMGKFTDLKAKIIFVKGSPIEAMTNRKRRFYFDQEGKLTSRFGIEHTPAVVRQAGRVMRVSEEVVTKRRVG